MKKHLNFSYHRSHKDNGFTLIELLVVILIIAILAAVGIVALISALNSGKKSSSTTVLRNGITAVRAWQSGQSQTNYDGISIAVLNAAEPDITWRTQTTEPVAGENSISFRLLSTGRVVLTTKSEKGVCYHALLIPDPTGTEKTTMYASAPSGAECTATAATTTSLTFTGSTKTGWNN